MIYWSVKYGFFDWDLRTVKSFKSDKLTLLSILSAACVDPFDALDGDNHNHDIKLGRGLEIDGELAYEIVIKKGRMTFSTSEPKYHDILVDKLEEASTILPLNYSIERRKPTAICPVGFVINFEFQNLVFDLEIGTINGKKVSDVRRMFGPLEFISFKGRGRRVFGAARLLPINFIVAGFKKFLRETGIEDEIKAMLVFDELMI